mmetsp:Transcript_11411/g.37477  ORF Transcript_11411/g.37477 Transcript_11411/m.37477 type:complete len:159 (+) Transcript_11411:198-674(+)
MVSSTSTKRQRNSKIISWRWRSPELVRTRTRTGALPAPRRKIFRDLPSVTDCAKPEALQHLEAQDTIVRVLLSATRAIMQSGLPNDNSHIFSGNQCPDAAQQGEAIYQPRLDKNLLQSRFNELKQLITMVKLVHAAADANLRSLRSAARPFPRGSGHA